VWSASDADGYVVEENDWDVKNGHYRVRVPEYPGSNVMVWIDVPDDADITEPNKAGPTMVWPIYCTMRAITYGSAALCRGA